LNAVINYDALAEKLRDYEIKKISIDKVLPDLLQPRKRYDFDKICELAKKMNMHGLISFPLVEKIKGGEYKEYIKKANGSSKLFSKIDDNKEYYFIVVGHRRWLAAMKAGFSHLKLRVLNRNLSLLERRIIQIDEDSMIHPPVWQKAKMTYNLYKLLSNENNGKNGRYTIKRFAEDIGISECTALEHIRYATLTDKIKNLVEKDKTLSYQNAIQIARLRNKKEQLVVLSKYGRCPAKKLKEIVDSILKKDKEKSICFKCEEGDKILNRELIHKKKEYFKEISQYLHRTCAFCDIDENYKKTIKKSIKDFVEQLSDSFIEIGDRINEITSNYFSFLEKNITLNGKKGNTESIERIIIKIYNEYNERRSKEKGIRDNLSEKYLKQIDIRLIKNDHKNYKIKDDEEIDSLAESIKRDGGLLNPILVKKTRRGYKTIFGNRRVCAARRANLDKIVAFVVDEIPKKLALDLQITENTQVPFSEHERAYGLSQIYDLLGEKSIDSFISQFGISRKTGLMALKYEKCLDDFVKKLVENKLISYSSALLLVGKDIEEQKALSLRAALNGYTKREMLELIKESEFLKKQQVLFRENNSTLDYKKISETLLLKLKELKHEINEIMSKKELLKNKEIVKSVFKTKVEFDKLIEIVNAA